jgi:hypothetical protein
MAKGPRRSMAEYKEVVNQARMRRKIKEAENKLLVQQNGVVKMCLQQTLLMDSYPGEAVHSTSFHPNMDVMQAIIVSIDVTQPTTSTVGVV